MSAYETIGWIGVDAGIVMLVDPCYIVPDEEWGKFCNEYNPGNHGFDEVRDGIVVQTAYGDGSYPVQVKKDRNGRIMEVRVIFDDPDGMEYPKDETIWEDGEDSDGDYAEGDEYIGTF